MLPIARSKLFYIELYYIIFALSKQIVIFNKTSRPKYQKTSFFKLFLEPLIYILVIYINHLLILFC